MDISRRIICIQMIYHLHLSRLMLGDDEDTNSRRRTQLMLYRDTNIGIMDDHHSMMVLSCGDDPVWIRRELVTVSKRENGRHHKYSSDVMGIFKTIKSKNLTGGGECRIFK